MKLPHTPPSLATLSENPEKMAKIVSFAMKGGQDSKYRHWDTIRHLTPPEGLSVEEWWFAIKLMRQGSRTTIPLNP